MNDFKEGGAGRRLTEQKYLKRPNPRFALALDDRQLSIVDQLVREEIRVCSACLEQIVEKERRRILTRRIKACREIHGRIGSLKGEAR